MVLLLAALAAAADRVVATDRVAAGVASDGSFGDAGLGLLADPDGPAGPAPVGGDWIAWGRVYEGWAVEAGERGDVAFAGYGRAGPELAWEAPADGSVAWRRGAGAGDGYDLVVEVASAWGTPLVRATLTLTAREDLAGVTVLRAFDPDPDAWSTGGYEADYTVEGEVVTAASPSDGRALALAALDGEGGTCGWCAWPSELGVGDGAGTADTQLGVRVPLGDLAAGASATVTFVYAFGEHAEGARDAALAALGDDDVDGDGVVGEADCDPHEDTVAAGLDEVTDGRDNDCDGAVDEDPLPAGDPADTGWAPALGADAPGEVLRGACATAPAPPWLGLGVLLLLRWRRR